MKTNLKKNGAITLISLVITIIILIILAGISVNLILGQNGLINRSEDAKERYLQECAKEKLEMELANILSDKETDKDYNQDNYLTQKLMSKGFIVNENIIMVDGWQFEIDRSILKIISVIENDKNYYIIVYNDNGQITQDKVEIGKQIKLKELTKEESIFLGWSLQPNGEIIDNEYKPSANITLYAQWLDKNYIYKSGKFNPEFGGLIQYKQKNGTSTINYLDNSIQVSTPNVSTSYHWGGIGTKDMIDTSEYNSMVIKYKQECSTSWYLTTNDVNNITTMVYQTALTTSQEVTIDLTDYNGNYYIGMWPKYSAEIEEIYFTN